MLQTKKAMAGLAALLGLLCSTSSLAGAGGEAFSDPAHRTQVPKGWEQAPIRYEPWAEGADLAVTLDQHLFRALLPAVKAFAQREGLNIAVREGTCGISAGKLTDRAVDMGGFCCAPGPEDRLPGLRYITLGIGAIALLANRDNPIEDLPLAQARELFEGSRVRWDSIAAAGEGLSGFVRPVGRLHCKRRPGHWRLLLDNEDLFSPRLIEVNTIADMIRSVARENHAIGFEVLWMVEQEKAWDRIRALSLDGTSPFDAERLAVGDYPLYRAFNVAIWEGGAANPHASALADHLKASMNALDPKFGIVPVARLRQAGWQFSGDELVGEPR